MFASIVYLNLAILSNYWKNYLIIVATAKKTIFSVMLSYNIALSLPLNTMSAFRYKIAQNKNEQLYWRLVF